MNKTEHGTFIDQGDIARAASEAAVAILNHVGDLSSPIVLYGVPRGGIPAAYAVQARLNEMRPEGRHNVADTPSHAHFIIDDVIDSGRTRDHMLALYPDKPFCALFESQGEWLIFPWEQAETRDTSAEDIPVRLLQYIGEDVKRGGLIETPARFLKAWRDWTAGYKQDPAEVLKVFEDGADSYDEMVLVRDIPVYSHCEHHLAPFFGVAHVAYIPNGHIVGLSKLSRLVDVYAKRLQVQERLTAQIADALAVYLKPKGVAVSLSCRHMCMESRGINRQGATTVTQCMRGAFMEDAKARAEFMGAIK